MMTHRPVFQKSQINSVISMDDLIALVLANHKVAIPDRRVAMKDSRLATYRRVLGHSGTNMRRSRFRDPIQLLHTLQTQANKYRSM